MNTPKYDMRRNPAYQLNCEVQAKGRRVASTKRRVKWSFGFSDLEAIEQGKAGNECRGAEHEVVMIWSLTSGKQRVLADGIEVHFANCRVGDKFVCEWTMNGGHNIKVVARIAPPLLGQDKCRQYDLQIDGISYWDMPKIYQLGAKANIPTSPVQTKRRLSSAISPDSCHSERDVQRRRQPLSEQQRRNADRPRRAQSMVQLYHHVPVADLLSDSLSPHSDFLSHQSSALPSPTSVSVATNSPSTINSASVGAIQSKNPWPRHYNMAAHDGASVCSSSSRSIETAPPRLSLSFAAVPSSPLETAINSLVNLDGSSHIGQFQTPPATPFDNFGCGQPSMITPTSTRNMHVPYGQVSTSREQPFTHTMPQTVFVGY